MGAKKAAVAVPHKILVAVFHMPQRAVAFADLGADYLDRLDKHRTAKRRVRRLVELGYEVMPGPRPQGDNHHAPPPVSAGAARAKFRASRGSVRLAECP